MDSDNVLVDPSLLVDGAADTRPRDPEYEFDYVVSDAFAHFVESSSEYADDPMFSFYR